MLRASLAVLAATVLVGVLSLLIVESRAVKEDYYIEHAERIRAIETSRNDLVAFVQNSRSTFDDGRAFSAAMDLALTRLAESNALLQAADERILSNPDIARHLASYDSGLKSFIANGRQFAATQNALADALRTLQEESPLIVKDLRRFNLRLQSQNAFSLAIAIIEHATGGGGEDTALLSQSIAALRNDRTIQSQVPGRIDAFTDAASNVIRFRAEAEVALQTMTETQVVDTLWGLSNAVLDENRRIVSRAERARLLLSVCTVLLLLGGGYAMFRLQTSYRALNKSNRELERANDSLEERVNERTRELSTAYEDLKESQVQLVQAEKMSSLGELVAGISHEINTPLWYLINNSTVLQERMEAVSKFSEIGDRMIKAVKSQHQVKESISQGLIDMQHMLADGFTDDIEEAKDLIKDSIEGLEELTELAQGLKDFSRLDRSRHGEFNINDGLDKTLLIARNKLKSKVTVHKYYGEVPNIHCSPSQINQIFLNLLTNAADAIEETGDIVLRTSAENDKVTISVADTGVGIPPELLAKIRDPFFTTKEVGKGTGLGLSIVDQIVTGHGGELRIQSEPGKGTTVTIILPVISRVPIDETAEQDIEEPAANDPEITAGAETEKSDDDTRDQPNIPEVATV